MKKIMALVLAAMLLLGCCSFAAAEELPEGYPEVIEGLDFGGQTVYIYDWWSSDDAEHSTRKADPDESSTAPGIRAAGRKAPRNWPTWLTTAMLMTCA